MKKIITIIREFFWPILEPKSSDLAKAKSSVFKEPDSIDKDIKEKSPSDLNILLIEARLTYEAEEGRRKTIESKGSTLVAFNSVLVALLVNGLPWLMSSKSNYLVYREFVVILLVITIVYFIRAIWFALLVYKRRAYHSITVPKVIEAAVHSEADLLRYLVVEYLSCTLKNYDTVNAKVDDMVMSYEYIKRGIVTLGIFIVALFLSYAASKLLLGAIKWCQHLFY